MLFLKTLSRALVLAALVVPSVAAQFAQLNVLNPQRSWFRQQGSIEEATLVVRPKGLYLQYDLYLTVSAQGASGFQNADSLEVEFLFDLPEEAAFIDSWLWIGDKIIRADLLDAWTASNIYENIVRRRQDPSILFKRSAKRYELRIYPMLRTETRKVRLSYLMPADWSEDGISAALPGHLLAAARFKPAALQVVTYPTALWQKPTFTAPSARPFEAVTDTVRGTYELGTLPPHQWTNPSLRFTVPLQDGLFMSQYTEGGEGWYQLALMPEAVFQRQGRKVLVLLDHEASAATMSMTDVLGQMRSTLTQMLTPRDSFAVMVSRTQPEKFTTGWMAASSANVTAVLDGVAARPPASYSSLPTLLDAGLDFMEEIGAGAVLVVSSATSHGDAASANSIIAELRRDHKPLPPIHVVDVARQYTRSYNAGGRWYSNNEYLYLNLSQISAGSLALAREASTFGPALGSALKSAGQAVDAFDLYVEAQGGYTYGRRSSFDAAARVYASEPIYQIGRFRGTPPFRVRASGLVGTEGFSRDLTLGPERVVGADSTLRTYWHTQQIRTLEAEAETAGDKALMAQIVRLSLEQRVLSRYTAFLALEPGQGGEVCATCYDESGNMPTDVEESELPGEVQVTAYPNPFRDALTLRVRLRQAAAAESVRAEVYDVLGRRVRVLTSDAVGMATEHTLRWDGTDEGGAALASGTYLVSVITPAGRRSVPVVRVQ